MTARQLPPRTTLGYVSGSDPHIVGIETAWPDSEKPPVYQARLSRHRGFVELRTLASNPRVGHCSVVAWADEIEAESIAEIGFDIQWCRVIDGPGTEKEAQVLVNVAELETVMRRLAEEKRLRFPKTMGALGRRAGGAVDKNDRELVALGLACWYAYQVHDRTRGVPDDQISQRREAMKPKSEIDQWEAELMDLE